MIIVNQDKNMIINLDNVVGIQVDGTNVVGAVLNYPEGIIIGEYKTEERAKEVLKDIVNKYRQYNMDKNQAVTIIPKVYEMPKE
jgi:predicted NBD/HSP70 family sugar kinase